MKYKNETIIGIVDNEVSFLEGIERKAVDKNLEMFTSTNPNEAIKWIEDKKVDVLVSDLQMPEINGIEVLTQARALDSEIELILVTGFVVSNDIRERCEELNARILRKSEGYQNLLHNLTINPANRRQSVLNKIEETQRSGHVFVSYVKEDFDQIKKICDFLEKHDINVWLDKNKIKPGEDWQIAISKAIDAGIFFIACFSTSYYQKSKVARYVNEEINLAIDKLRKMPDDQIWFIPVKLDECEIPYFEIRRNKTLESKQFVQLAKNWENGMRAVVDVIQNNR